MSENKFVQLKTDYEIPKLLQDAIDALEEGVKNHVTYIDCLQDEVHACCRELDDDEREREIIEYYCLRRW